MLLQGPKVEGGHASARSLSFDGQSAAAAARTAVPIDLMTVAARVDAGSQVATIFGTVWQLICYNSMA